MSDIDEVFSATRYGTQYLGVKEGDVGWIIDNLDARIALTDFDTDNPEITTLEIDEYTGEVFAVGKVSGQDTDTIVYKWDDENSFEFRWQWKSKQEVIPRPVNMGAVMVHLEELGPGVPVYMPDPGDQTWPDEYQNMDPRTQVLVELYCNDTLRWTGICENREQVRIDSGYKGDTWEVKVYGQVRVYSIALAETGRELQGV